MLGLVPLLYISAAAASEWPKWETPCEDCVDGVVLGGADVVAYFGLNPQEQGIMGSPHYSVNYRGYRFYFANSSNAETFQKQPEKYVPAWGGFCAYGIVREGSDSPDPKAQARDPYPHEGWRGRLWPWSASHLGPPCDPHNGWRIVNERLFCALSRGIMDMFVAFGPQGVEYGDERWANWYGDLGEGPMNTGCFPGPTLETCLHYPGLVFPNRTVAHDETEKLFNVVGDRQMQPDTSSRWMLPVIGCFAVAAVAFAAVRMARKSFVRSPDLHDEQSSQELIE